MIYAIATLAAHVRNTFHKSKSFLQLFRRPSLFSSTLQVRKTKNSLSHLVQIKFNGHNFQLHLLRQHVRALCITFPAAIASVVCRCYSRHIPHRFAFTPSSQQPTFPVEKDQTFSTCGRVQPGNRERDLPKRGGRDRRK